MHSELNNAVVLLFLRNFSSLSVQPNLAITKNIIICGDEFTTHLIKGFLERRGHIVRTAIRSEIVQTLLKKGADGSLSRDM